MVIDTNYYRNFYSRSYKNLFLQKIKKRGFKMSKKQFYIYKGFERFWHWMQAILIFFLAFTGFEIHGTYTFFGFRDAVRYHNIDRSGGPKTEELALSDGGIHRPGRAAGLAGRLRPRGVKSGYGQVLLAFTQSAGFAAGTDWRTDRVRAP